MFKPFCRPQKWPRWFVALAIIWIGLLFIVIAPRSRAVSNGEIQNDLSREAGLRAFADVATVLRHPRCINCHPAGDVPRQTDARLPHFPPVARGDDNHGAVGMRCSTCHQQENQLNGLPGAPGWGVAPRSMAWEGLNDQQLAEQLKDPKRNGGRTLEQIIDHLNQEHLVQWAWQPGGHRTVPPLSHAEFVRRFQDWIAAGAPIPDTNNTKTHP